METNVGLVLTSSIGIKIKLKHIYIPYSHLQLIIISFFYCSTKL